MDEVIIPSLALLLGEATVVPAGRGTNDPRPIKDITIRSSQMPRGSCLLYPNHQPRGDDPPHYRGLLKDRDGAVFWVACWKRTVKDRLVLEIQLIPQ